MNILRFMRIHS